MKPFNNDDKLIGCHSTVTCSGTANPTKHDRQDKSHQPARSNGLDAADSTPYAVGEVADWIGPSIKQSWLIVDEGVDEKT